MNQITSIFTTVEIAEMMNVPHGDVLKKIEGRKDRKGYIQVLNEGQMSVVDFFKESSYIDAKGEARKCYEITKLGCDFLANKFTGEKGILFTARYVERFNEMEHSVQSLTITDHPGEVANLIKVLSSIMNKQGTVPYKIAENAKIICEQYGISLTNDFVKIPEYEQMQLSLTK